MNAPPFAGRFNRLIGLSPTGPTCQQVGLTLEDITASDSPLFVTDIDSLNLDLSEAATDCGPDSLWQILAAARTNGLITMETDLLAAFDSLNTRRLQPFRGMIGQTESMGVVAGLSEGDTVSVALATNELPGAFVRITRIGLLVSNDADVQVSLPGLGAPVTVVCSANTASYTTLPEPLLLPLDGQSKTISYQIAGFRPRNNKLNCSCGGQQERVNQYLPGLVNTAANGLLLQAEAGCDALGALYESYQDGEAVSRVLATTLRLITLANAIQRIITSGQIKRFTLMENDQLYGKRNAYLKDYADRINWLAGPKGVDFTRSACYLCAAPEPRIQKRGILS